MLLGYHGQPAGGARHRAALGWTCGRVRWRRLRRGGARFLVWVREDPRQGSQLDALVLPAVYRLRRSRQRKAPADGICAWFQAAHKGHRRERCEATAGTPAQAGLQPAEVRRGWRLWLGDRSRCARLPEGGGSRGGRKVRRKEPRRAHGRALG